ncbi:hypothetical protein AMATHDRAFT_66055 [Amanita thiersii Skay4041]|uniref:Uncharacterized protein n=1 Tax=Amanita thiersii Skay4041 TaxID=703135 RepID=A0A2A9NKI8_9AGAR|nr:hypothetical protein AMATHDRAFT_66055 [Amanita thiersii Skay4041]
MMKQGIEVRRSIRRNYGFLLEQVRRDVQCWQGELEEARRREREELEQCPPPYASHPRDRRCFEQAREDAPGGVEVVVVAPNPRGQMPQPGGVVAGEELQELEVTVPVVPAADVPDSASEADAGERAEPSPLPRSPTRAAQKQRESRRVREGASISSSSSAGLSGTDSAVIRYPPPSYSP